jgi:hypothetical protein
MSTSTITIRAMPSATPRACDNSWMFDSVTGERTFGNDYYQDMMLWSLPTAIEGKDLGSAVEPGRLVYRVIEAAKRGRQERI